MPNRAAIYCRSSKDISDVSIDAQRRALHDLAATRNLVVVDEYADAVESGKDADRPAFQRLLRDLKAPGRPWSWVLVLDTSRVARRRILAMMFERDCAARRVKIVYRNLPDTDPATDMIIRSVFQAFDEYHSLVSKSKGLAGMAENVRQGWRAGGRAPRGYKLEYHATGAIRDGQPVLKSRLVVDEEIAGQVRAYLKLRATGVARGSAINRLRLPWPASSTHSMDWQALTYAGHTVWNMHAEREGGGAADGQKRRPRAEWLVARNTHPALITDDEAEAILRQQEMALQGRRVRSSPLLFSGLVQTPDGRAWHSDGGGGYRLGKGRRIDARRLETAVLAKIEADLQEECSISLLMAAIAEFDETPVDGRQVAAAEKRLANLTQQIGRTVDLAGRMDDPAPVLRRVADLEAARAALAEELEGLRARVGLQAGVRRITRDDVRLLLAGLFAEIRESAAQCAPESRLALGEVLDHVELDPESLACRVHYAVKVPGDQSESLRDAKLSPVRWVSEPLSLHRRAA